MSKRDIVNQARARFDQELHTDEYRKIHGDGAHLEALMNLIDVHAQKCYLDLGTGNGYLAFEMARRFPDIKVTGIDIATRSIQQNQRLQQEQDIQNLDFRSYNGMKFPFDDGLFAGVICRYAFHHFPDPAFSIEELHRIIEPDGFVIISDPITYADDTDGFIDQFQLLKTDGHVHFFRIAELDALFQQRGFIKETCFFSTVSYSRDMNDAYSKLFGKSPASILEKYCIELEEKTVRVTVSVMNVQYRKIGKQEKDIRY
ncbi:MAG: class I SAM-dependent methyltransferase [Anaerolineaceae bacterium]|nr:class I SAM-dependent methyltransferase [Anaerolineaceae bacterium]